MKREWPSGKATDFDVCTRNRISVDRGFDPLLAFNLLPVLLGEGVVCLRGGRRLLDPDGGKET